MSVSSLVFRPENPPSLFCGNLPPPLMERDRDEYGVTVSLVYLPAWAGRLSDTLDSIDFWASISSVTVLYHILGI